MAYQPILNGQGFQVGYIDGETAHDVRGRMVAHVRRDGGLMRLGDRKIVGSVTDTASGVTVSADAELLFQRR